MNKIFIFLLIFLSVLLFAEEKNSNSIYKEDIKEFDRELDKINKELKQEEKDIAYLKNNLINNEISTSKLIVKLINKDDGFFKITNVKITMNGNVIFKKSELNKKNITIFKDSSDPGTYTFNFQFTVEGAGYGIFTYMKSYKYKINQTKVIEVKDIRNTELNLIIYKKKVDDKNPKNMLGIKIENKE